MSLLRVVAAAAVVCFVGVAAVESRTVFEDAPSVWGDVPAAPTPGAVQTGAGFVLPVVTDHGDGTYDVRTPCDATAAVSGEPLAGAHIVLDPGHGGEEPGAVAADGQLEKDLNLDIAQRTAAVLRAEGATVVLTRPGDERVTVAIRAAIATAVGPEAFLSIHHNASPEVPATAPGTEAYFQVADPESRRLAGLVVEEVRAALAAFPTPWSSDDDPGAKARLRAENPFEDYYGVLRGAAGVPSVLVEAAYLSNPDEAALLARDDVRQAEAEALARALLRFRQGEVPAATAYAADPPSTGGSGGSGGTVDGCTDPALQ